MTAPNTDPAESSEDPVRRHAIHAQKDAPVQRSHLDLEEIQGLFRASRAHPCGKMLRLIAGVGARLGEVVQLKVSDCDFEARQLALRGPGGQANRTLAYPDSIHFDLLRESQGRAGEDPLFSLRSNAAGRPTPIARRTVQHYLTVTSAKLGLGVVTVKTLRTTLALELLVRGIDERLVAQTLGYANRKPIRRVRELLQDRPLRIASPIG